MGVSSGLPTSLVNSSEDGIPSEQTGKAITGAISGNGKYVAFTSESNLIDGVSNEI